jgi:Arc/MetJ-type ribon-helix-helix transcriptional regulator
VGRDAISAVKLSEGLTAEIDAWAEAHDVNRSDAIRQLVQLGLSAASAVQHAASRRDPVEIEGLAVSQMERLLDPSLPTEERERRIRRLTEGPPEFADERIDLPKPRE